MPRSRNIFENVRNSSNLRRSSRRPTHQFDFSNIVDDPIEIEKVGDPSEDSEKGSACGEKASSEDNSQDTSNAPDETKTTEGSLHERATTIGEGQYEHTSWPTPSPACYSPSFFSVFFFLGLVFSIL